MKRAVSELFVDDLLELAHRLERRAMLASLVDEIVRLVVDDERPDDPALRHAVKVAGPLCRRCGFGTLAGVVRLGDKNLGVGRFAGCRLRCLPVAGDGDQTREGERKQSFHARSPLEMKGYVETQDRRAPGS